MRASIVTEGHGKFLYRMSVQNLHASLLGFAFLVALFVPAQAHAVAYNIADATFSGVALDISEQETDAVAMIFNNDGTALYVVGYNTDDIKEYTLSTPYDISSGSFTQIALSVAVNVGAPTDILFNNDGTKLYVLDGTIRNIEEYTLSTPYDISSGSFTQTALDVSGQGETGPNAIIFNNDGTKLYVVGVLNDEIEEYTLSTPYDISSGSFTQTALNVSGQESFPFDMLFNNDGTRLYVIGGGVDKVNEYTLSTPYDISSGSFTQIALDVSNEEGSPNAMLFNDDGSTLFILGRLGDDISEYSLVDSTAPTVSITSPADGSTVFGTAVTISANASDDTGVAGVSFYVNGTLEGSEDTSAPYEITWNSTATSSGSQIIVAVARDSANNVATSASRTVTADNTPTPSSVQATADNTSATISWSSARVGSSRAFFGIASSVATSTSETNVGGTATTSHSVQLSNLVPCTVYGYRVVSRNPSGLDTATSTENTLTTSGCAGGASISANSEEAITTGSGGTLSEGNLALTAPVSFTATTSVATFQISALDSAAFIAGVGAPSGKSRVGTIYHLAAIYDEITSLETFDEPLTVAISYSDSNVTGLDEPTLTVYRYDGSSWGELSDCAVDTAANTVTCTTTAFSEFGIFGSESPEDSSGATRSTSVNFGCKDSSALNYEPFSRHKQELCEYGNTGQTLRGIVLQHRDLLVEAYRAGFVLPPAVLTILGLSPAPAIVRDLTYGMQGDDVTALQNILITEGYIIDAGATGFFYAQTQSALAAYQRDHGISPALGYFGPITRLHMRSVGVEGVWW